MGGVTPISGSEGPGGNDLARCDLSGKAAAIGETDRYGHYKPGAADLIAAAGAKAVRVSVPPHGVEKGWTLGT